MPTNRRIRRSVALITASAALACVSCASRSHNESPAPSSEATNATAVREGRTAGAPGFREVRVPFKEEPGIDLSIRAAVFEPDGGVPPLGDVLYFHGFGDRLDNHGPLFDTWRARGLRVVAFDLPSHGETTGRGGALDLHDFSRLGRLAARVEEATREDASRPLIFAGWSTGALVAIRMIQSQGKGGFPALVRPVRGAVFFAPAVSVHALVGENGKVTERTLTRNPAPPHKAPPTPASPLLSPLFAGFLVAASKRAFDAGWEWETPLHVFVAGKNEDACVQSDDLVRWVATKTRGSVSAAQCAGAFHELDNEPNPVGAEVRRESGAALAAFATGARYVVPEGNACVALPAGVE